MFDANRYDGLFAFRWRAVDRVGDFDSCDDAAESGELAIEMRTIADKNKKMRGRAVSFVTARHRDNPTHVLDVARLVRQVARHPRRQLRAPLLAGGKIAALNHKAFHYAAERRRIERAGRRQIKKTP